eukprot:283826_1
MNQCNFEWLRTIPQNTINCVFGYIHEAQRLLPSDAPYYNIPELVAYICLDYYFAREMFDTHGKYFKLNEQKDIATMIKQPSLFNNVFGMICTDPKLDCIYLWNIKFTGECCNTGTFGVGFNCSEHVKLYHDIDACYMDQSQHCIAFWNIEGAIEGPNDCFTENTMLGFNEEDIITVEMNTKDKLLKFHTNGKDHGIVKFKDDEYQIDWTRKYQLAVSMWRKGSVELISFQRQFV